MKTYKKSQLRRQISRKSLWQTPWFYLLLLLGLILSAIGIYQIPAVHDKAYYYVASARADIYYFFRPPGKDVFQPSGQASLQPEVIASLTAMAPTPTPTLAATALPEATPEPSPTPLPTPTPTAIPGAVTLDGIRYEKQGFNNCGPANLSMALNFWGWDGDQTVTEAKLKPFIQDRNVMPYEMMDFVLSETSLGAIVRYGGDLEMAKRFIAAGFPVLIERGYFAPGAGWMGHYGLLYAYDDAIGKVRIPDTYIGDVAIEYEEIQKFWNEFDGIYIIIYPAERVDEVLSILGPHADVDYNLKYALEKATDRTQTQEGSQLFFAWYTRGSVLVEMHDYFRAADAYDRAFEVYEALYESARPWRITWYQTGPYFAYYYMGRYQDVLDLADQTLRASPEDAIPETWVWRGRANVMLGKTETAITDFCEALKWHPGWWVAENELYALGVTP